MSTQANTSPRPRTWTRVDVPGPEWLEENLYICARCKVFVQLNPSYNDIRGCPKCLQTFNILGLDNIKCLIKKDEV